MKIFFDTEFTGLHKDTTLISLGMIDEEGRSFYAEFVDYDVEQCDDWIKENVISNLKYRMRRDNWIEEGPQTIWGQETICGGYKEYIREKLSEWLSVYDEVELISDVCHYDMVLFIDIFGSAFDLPKNVNAACHDINQDIAEYYGISEKEAFDKNREQIADDYRREIKGSKHNALYDAKVIKVIYAGLNGFLYMI